MLQLLRGDIPWESAERRWTDTKFERRGHKTDYLKQLDPSPLNKNWVKGGLLLLRRYTTCILDELHEALIEHWSPGSDVVEILRCVGGLAPFPAYIASRYLCVWDARYGSEDSQLTVGLGAAPTLDFLVGKKVEWSTLRLMKYKPQHSATEYRAILQALPGVLGPRWNMGAGRFVPP